MRVEGWGLKVESLEFGVQSGGHRGEITATISVECRAAVRILLRDLPGYIDIKRERNDMLAKFCLLFDVVGLAGPMFHF